MNAINRESQKRLKKELGGYLQEISGKLQKCNFKRNRGPKQMHW